MLRTRTLTCGLAIVGLLSAGCSQQPAPARADKLVSEVSANGVTEGACREVALRPETGGVLGVVHVHENQNVQAGQVLFELKSASHRAQVELATAELEAARADARHAEQSWARSSRLVTRGAISTETYETDQFQRSLTLARVGRAEAQLAVARAELDKMQVKAPFAGTILQVLAEPGATVAPQGTPAVLRMVDLSKRRVRAFVEELDVDRIRIGQRASISVDGIAERSYTGKVVRLALRMGKTTVQDDAPDEYKDVYFREVLIDVEGARDLPVNLRVHVKIAADSE